MIADCHQCLCSKNRRRDYENYAALIKQIVDAQKAVAALNMPEGTATLDEGVKAADC